MADLAPAPADHRLARLTPARPRRRPVGRMFGASLALGLLAAGPGAPAHAAPAPVATPTVPGAIAAPAPTAETAAAVPAVETTPETTPELGVVEPPAPTPGQRAVDAALTRIGKPYSWGSAGPNAFDCSGLTMWAYGQVGIGVGHYTGSQYARSERISEAELRPGDLVFYWSGRRGGDPSHVGLYIGDGNIVHAPGRGRSVQVQSVYYWPGASVAFGRL